MYGIAVSSRGQTTTDHEGLTTTKSILEGIINISKPFGPTSFSVVESVRRVIGAKKAGHIGTLDPIAEGILPVAIGKATKLIPFIHGQQKKYIFEIKWGEKTSTDDSEGVVINTSKRLPKEEEINEKLKNFLGYIDQTPPKASAVKINGKRAYQLLRENKNIELKPKKVFVSKIKLLNSIDKHYSTFEIECGKGFYVRAFARDLAESLGTFGHIVALKRAKVGLFAIETAILLDDLIKIRQTHQEFNFIHSSVSMLDDILAYEVVEKEDLKNLSLGKSIILNLNNLIKPLLNSVDKKLVFLSCKGNIISYGKLNNDLFIPKKILL